MKLCIEISGKDGRYQVDYYTDGGVQCSATRPGYEATTSEVIALMGWLLQRCPPLVVSNDILQRFKELTGGDFKEVARE